MMVPRVSPITTTNGISSAFLPSGGIIRSTRSADDVLSASATYRPLKWIASGAPSHLPSAMPIASGEDATWPEGCEAFLEQGGVYVQANLRGGNEYGEAWHQAGMKEKKQNVFDDFVAVAEWLFEHGYTRSDKLAIAGPSEPEVSPEIARERIRELISNISKPMPEAE